MPPNAQPNYIHSTPPVIQVEEATQISFLFKRVVYLCIIEKKKKRLLYITYTYSSVPKLLSLLTFLFLFDYLSYSILKKIIYFAMICFIIKENSNTTYNFTYLN